MKLAGKVAIVTGGGSGIGSATAQLFAKEGAKVVVVGRTIEKLKKTVTEITEEGGEAIMIRGDVSKKEEVTSIVSTTVKNFNTIDILINNAAICPVQPFFDISEEDWNEVIDIDLNGCFLCSQTAAKVMRKNGGGKIVNISSISGVRAVPHTAAYCAAKAGVIMLTRVMAMELAPYKINVNAIAPGGTDTPMFQVDFTKAVKQIPWGRIGLPIDMAQVALFLSSSEADFITGTTVIADGGQTAGENLPFDDN